MLGREIHDPHHTESDVEFVLGLNLLDFTTVLEREKITRQATARFARPQSLGGTVGDRADPLFSGYEIHLGETLLGNGTQPLFQMQRLGDEGSHHDGAISGDGRVLGTYLHGLFDSAEGLGVLLKHWRKTCDKEESSSRVIDPLAERERRYDALADHFRSNLKMDVIYRALDEQR
jgi:adenosylcobyric acid synthase